MKRCIIITSYIEGDLKTIYVPEPGDTVICADNGYLAAAKAGIVPDLLIGDYDSLQTDLPDGIRHLTFPVHKDYTDTGLCLDWACTGGFKNVSVIGGLGGRLDHTLANLQDLIGFTRRGLHVEMFDRINYVTVLDGPAETTLRADTLRREKAGDPPVILGEDGPRLGLFAFTEKVSGIFSSGVEYPLSDAVLRYDFPLGSGNPFTEEEVRIRIDSGTLLVSVSDNK
ncbi:MAG: thiamine diphosphokinase [Eubacteriaceae bacterium]|nr:thiamine diphosphokinase [Eubacteriaceae bacterium]